MKKSILTTLAILMSSVVSADSLECPRYAIGDIVTSYDGWCSYFSVKQKIPLLVSYKLTSEMVTAPNATRPTDFKPDPSIPKTMQSTDKGYYNSGFDRGHMASNDSFNFSESSARNTFYFSNITPQVPKLNRQLWLNVERIERSLAYAHGSVHVDNYAIGSLGQLIDGTNIPVGLLKVITVNQSMMQCYYFDQQYVVGGLEDCSYFDGVTSNK